MKIIPIILCGGSGTRLWPLSRKLYPKQLLALVGDNSLLQNTVSRIESLDCVDCRLDIEKSLYVSNEEHRFLVAQQLQELGQIKARIVLEPEGRNTAPALSAAAEIICQEGEDALMMVMPADHLIKDEAAFHAAICEATSLARKDYLVTFGIVPAHPETGYGYIEHGKNLDGKEGCFSIKQFVEKPDLETATGYVDSGDFFWNSGMFLIKASVWLKAVSEMKPEISKACQQAVGLAEQDLDFIRLNRDAFINSPADSIDYAVMENVTETATHPYKGAVVALDAGWSDIGAWDSLWEVSEKQAAGNVLRGDVITDDTSNSMVLAEHRLVTTVGLENIIIIETADAVLVADKTKAQNVKNIVNQIKALNRDEADIHRCVYRPWGNYQGIDLGARFQVKRIVVNPGAQLSLQMHHHRAEHWVVVSGTARVTKGEETFLLSENQSTYIPIGVVHRLENPGTIPLEIIEVQSGSYLGEDDIVRFQDQYGRGKSKEG